MGNKLGKSDDSKLNSDEVMYLDVNNSEKKVDDNEEERASPIVFEVRCMFLG